MPSSRLHGRYAFSLQGLMRGRSVPDPVPPGSNPPPATNRKYHGLGSVIVGLAATPAVSTMVTLPALVGHPIRADGQTVDPDTDGYYPVAETGYMDFVPDSPAPGLGSVEGELCLNVGGSSFPPVGAGPALATYEAFTGRYLIDAASPLRGTISLTWDALPKVRRDYHFLATSDQELLLMFRGSVPRPMTGTGRLIRIPGQGPR